MRKNQKGFTLVELIIAVAILAIVTLSVCGFIVVGSRSYTSANTDIMLQQEAQLALNQISDVIIDTTESINYGSGTEMVLKDSEFSSEPDEKDLVVINSHDGLTPTDSSLQNNNLCYQFEWRKDTETIYFRDSEAVITETHPKPDEDEWNDWAILAQHVKELHIDISQFEENRVVMISMTFQNGNKEYTTSNNVTVRNRVAINKIDIEPMKKAQEFTIMTADSVILEPGDTFNLADKTQVMTTSDDDAVKWELVDPGTTTSTISPDGQLSIGTNETRQSFSVRVSRENEEYENQNKKVSKTVKVNIKRVNSVDLSCSATTVKAGSTITINGIASGYLLGASCEAHSCLGDDENKDYDLVPDRWRIVRGPATIVDDKRGVKEVEIKISASAKKGDEIEIEATSYLSTRKSYGIVTGTLVLKVTEGTNGAKFIGSELKFGTDNDPGIFDHMRQSLKTDHGQYIFCIRVRETGTVGCQNDQVMVYFTVGANERFSPDAFGLDHRKSYEVYFQVLDARPKGSTQEASKEMVRAEYPNNLDDNGKYIGEMFEADEYYYGLLNPPFVSVKVDGEIYPNGEEDRYIHRSLNNYGPGNGVIGGITTAGGDGVINIWENAILNNLGYTLYKEEKDGSWRRIYGIDYDMQDYPSESERKGTTRIGDLTLTLDGEGKPIKHYEGTNRLGCLYFEPQGSSMTMKREGGDLQLACGTYHIIPGYVYANDPHMREGYYEGDNIIIKDVNKDYAPYYYKQWDSVINVKIDSGFNLQLPNENNNEERWTFFPLPSDLAFPFDLRSEEVQKTSYNFRKYSLVDGQDKGGIDNATVTCEYIEGRDTYSITLSAVEVNGRTITNHVYGKYEANMGSDIWESVGEEKKTSMQINMNLTFDRDNAEWETYFPAPEDADFPKSAFDNASTLNDWQLIEFNKYNNWEAKVERAAIRCEKSGNDYKITITAEATTYDYNPHKKIIYTYGTFTWNRDNKMWIRTSSGNTTREEVAVWGSLIYFEYNGSCKMEMPLPGEQGFPSFLDSYSDNASMQYFYKDDKFGDYKYLYTNQEVTRIYSYKNGIYTLTLRNTWNSQKEYGTWTCPSGGSEWTKQ